MKRRRVWQSLLRCCLTGLASIPLLTACPKRPPAPPIASDLPDEAALRAALDQSIPLADPARPRAAALVSPFKLKLTHQGRTDRLDGALALSWPPGGALQARIELYGPLGPPLAYAVMRPDQALLYLPYSGNRALSTSAPQALLARGGLGLELLLELLLEGGLPCTGLGPAHPLQASPISQPRQAPPENLSTTMLGAECLTTSDSQPPPDTQPPPGTLPPSETLPQTHTQSLTLIFTRSPLTLWGLEREVRGQAKTRIRLSMTEGGPEQRPRLSGFQLTQESAEPPQPLILDLTLDEAARSAEVPDDPALFHLAVPEEAVQGRLEDWMIELNRSAPGR